MNPEGNTVLVLSDKHNGYLVFNRFSELSPEFYQEHIIRLGYTVNPNKWDLEKAKAKINKQFNLELTTLTVR